MPNQVNFRRVESIRRKDGHIRLTYVYKCEDCETDIRVRADNKNHGGRCAVHSHVKRPYESIYNGLVRDWRGISVELTYDEYLEFTKITNCHYCGGIIPWMPYATVKGKFHSAAYFLDRKDNTGSYSKSNCVVCCTSCNHIKGNHFTYEEFLGVGKILAKRVSNGA